MTLTPREARLAASSTTVSPVEESFADYLAACPPPVEGWASDPQAVRMRAVLYVRRHALADARSPFEVAERIAEAWLHTSSPAV